MYILPVLAIGTWLLLHLCHVCHGLAIDIMETESSDCRYPPVKITCRSTIDELQAGSNQISITHGGLTLASCTLNNGCTTASKRYNATMDGVSAILTITDMDAFYDSPTWSCIVASNTASLKLKYFKTETEDFSMHLVSLKGTTIVDLLTLLVVMIILVIIVIQVFCRNCCNNHSERDSDSDSEFCSCSRLRDLFSRKQKPEIKTGYTGKKYEVKTTYVIDDPNVVPDARFNDGRDRKKEAEIACKNVTAPQKEKIAENLTEWTEVRKPLVANTSDPGV